MPEIITLAHPDEAEMFDAVDEGRFILSIIRYDEPTCHPGDAVLDVWHHWELFVGPPYRWEKYAADNERGFSWALASGPLRPLTEHDFPLRVIRGVPIPDPPENPPDE